MARAGLEADTLHEEEIELEQKMAVLDLGPQVAAPTPPTGTDNRTPSLLGERLPAEGPRSCLRAHAKKHGDTDRRAYRGGCSPSPGPEMPSAQCVRVSIARASCFRDQSGASKH